MIKSGRFPVILLGSVEQGTSSITMNDLTQGQTIELVVDGLQSRALLLAQLGYLTESSDVFGLIPRSSHKGLLYNRGDPTRKNGVDLMYPGPQRTVGPAGQARIVASPSQADYAAETTGVHI